MDLTRRETLALSGVTSVVAFATAGCLGGETETGIDAATAGESGDNEGGVLGESEIEPALELDEGSIAFDNDADDGSYVSGVVTNVSPADLEYAEVVVRVYDAEHDHISTGLANTLGLGSGDAFGFDARLRATEDEIAEYDVVLTWSHGD